MSQILNLDEIKNIKSLLNKEMSRKEFVMYILAFFLSISGFFSILYSLTHPVKTKGYGSSSYGGKE